ncbi:peptidoglycan glycosyltransferase [Runella rosea]|uniref:Peptidoglycan glycosyltransferase n=1 Tax=Runella rosea TaxID=2259595 RepID=A0A344TCH7_9BACT|nr:penicillin-binding transpeptidase domain-containing protein [Runella rosea]AXE16348.1 peptidoglycan glycosyltransferase [Runella rosea]
MSENRKFFVYGLFVLVGIIYLIRLLYLQVLDNTYETASNSIRAIPDVPMRGQVYDRYGNLIVYNTLVYDLYVTPNKLKVADTLALCNALSITRADFDSLMKAAKVYSRKKPSLFLRQLSKEDFAHIQDVLVDYPGFEYVKSSVRTYSAPTLAHALGYVSEVSQKQLDAQEYPYYRQGDLMGQSGLEKFYEEYLRGQRGVRYVMQDVNGVAKGPWKGGELDTIAQAGQNLYTSIDLEIQQYVDSLMQGKAGAVVAIEPSSGEVLAITSAPSYDPALFATRDFSKNYAKLALNPYRPLLNRAVMGSYRPGSTFKTVQALVAMQEGAISPGSIFSHAGAPMKCHGHGGLSGVHSAIQWSCNPYFYHVFRRMIYANTEKNTFKASAMGLRKWHDYTEKFGFGQKLGIDLPSEALGKLPNVEFYDKWYGVNGWKFSNIYSLSIGEGELLITPLKLANLAATIANRGWYIAPHLVKGIGKNDNPLPEFKQRHETGVDRRYFEPVVDGMEMAVVRGTVSRGAIIPDIVMCGKTGTSQNKKGKDHSIFIAFAPKDNPKIAIAVFVENAGFGGFAAAPVASLVIEKYIKRHIDRKAYEQEWMNKNFLQNVIIPKSQLPKPKEQKPTPTKPEATIVNREKAAFNKLTEAP